MTLDEQIQRGMKAEMILNDALFQEMVQDVEIQAVADWKFAQSIAEREMCWMKVQALDAVMKELRAVRDNALMVEKRIGKDGNK